MTNTHKANGRVPAGDLTRTVTTAGVVAGAALGVWAGKRIQAFAQQDRPDGMIDWRRTREIAVGMNKGETLTAVDRERLDAYYGDLVARCIPIPPSVHRRLNSPWASSLWWTLCRDA